MFSMYLYTHKIFVLRLYNTHNVVTKVLDCGLEVRKFKLNLHDCVYFQINTLGKGMNSTIPQTMAWIVPLLFFYKDVFGTK